MNEVQKLKNKIAKLENDLTEVKNLHFETEKQANLGSYKINLNTGEAYWTNGLLEIFNLPINSKPPNSTEYYNYVHKDDIDKVKSMLEKCIYKNTPFDLKYRIVLQNNQLKHVHSKSKVIRTENKEKYLIGFFIDITKEIELENLSKLFIDSIQEGFSLNEAIYDDEGNIIDHKILIANKSFNSHSAYKADEIIGRKASEIYNMDRKFIKEWWQTHRNKEFPVHYEMFQQETQRWSYISTSQVLNDKFVTAFLDITNIKEKELLLAESEKKYKNLVENAPLGIALFNEENILFANKYLLGLLFQKNQLDITKYKFIDFVANEDKNRFAEILKTFIDKKLPENKSFRLVLNAAHEKIIVEILLSKLMNNNDQTWKCIISNISDKTKIQNKAKRLSTDAIYMSRKLHLFSEINNELHKIIEDNDLDKSMFLRLRNKLKEEKNTEQLWQIFQENFEIVYDDFFKKLLDRAPNLTQLELKHCAFIKINFETKEIAKMFNVKPTTVQMGRVRIKKKFQLDSEQELLSFIHTL